MIKAKNLIYLSVFSAPLYLIKISLFGAPTNVLEILIGITFAVWLWENKKFSWRDFYNSYKIYLTGILLIFLGLAVSVLANENYLTGLGIIKGWFAFPLVLAFIILNEVKSKKDIENILKAFYLSAAIIGAVSLIYFLKGDLTYDFRLKAFYLSPNYLAMFLAPAVFIGNYLISARLAKKRAKTALLLASQLIILAVIYFTYSYAVWAAIALSFIAVALIKRSDIFKKIRIGLILLGLFLAVLTTQLDNPKFGELFDWQASSRSSLSSRVMIWKSAGKILKDNPLWGIGPGNFQDKYLEYQKHFPLYLDWAVPQPHNLYLAFWLQGGILGLVGFLWLIFIWIKDVVGVVKGKKINLALLGMMLYILLHGLVDTTYWKNDLAVVFWIIFSLGIIVADYRKHKLPVIRER